MVYIVTSISGDDGAYIRRICNSYAGFIMVKKKLCAGSPARGQAGEFIYKAYTGFHITSNQ